MRKTGCVFVGAFDYRPNVDAACWFCREAWPEIHRRRPDARLRLVGRRPVAAVRRLGAVPGVEVVGQVPDVRPYLAAAAVAVNPLRIARGLQNKVLEAMAMGKAVVASPQALAGLRHRDDAPPLCARSAQEWIEMVGEAPGSTGRAAATGRRGPALRRRASRLGRVFAAVRASARAFRRLGARRRQPGDFGGGGAAVMGNGRGCGTAAPPPAARHYAWLAAAFAAFALYGSLVPLDYRPLPWEEAQRRWAEVCSRPVRVESRSDWAANILLFFPLGFLGMAALCVDRRRGADCGPCRRPRSAWPISALLEFLQLYFPPRDSSLNDIVAESIGAVLGIALWIAAGRPLTRGARSAWSETEGDGTAARLLIAYLVVLALIQVFPPNLTLSPVELYHKYKAGLVRPVPFAYWAVDPRAGVKKDAGRRRVVRAAGFAGGARAALAVGGR